MYILVDQSPTGLRSSSGRTFVVPAAQEAQQLLLAVAVHVDNLGQPSSRALGQVPQTLILWGFFDFGLGAPWEGGSEPRLMLRFCALRGTTCQIRRHTDRLGVNLDLFEALLD